MLGTRFLTQENYRAEAQEDFGAWDSIPCPPAILCVRLIKLLSRPPSGIKMQLHWLGPGGRAPLYGLAF